MKHLPVSLALAAALLLVVLGLPQAARAQYQAPPVWHASGNIDYVHSYGDYLAGNFCPAYYQVTVRNEGNLYNGERNNGLYVEELYGCFYQTPQFDPNLTLFNGCPATNGLVSCLPPSNGSNPMSFVVYLSAPCGIQLSVGECRGSGVGGNVGVDIQRLW